MGYVKAVISDGVNLWTGIPYLLDGLQVLEVFERGENLHLKMKVNDVRYGFDFFLELVIVHHKSKCPVVDVFCDAREYLTFHIRGASAAKNVFFLSLPVTLWLSPALLVVRSTYAVANRFRGYNQYQAEMLRRIKGQVNDQVYDVVKSAFKSYYRDGLVVA